MATDLTSVREEVIALATLSVLSSSRTAGVEATVGSSFAASTSEEMCDYPWRERIVNDKYNYYSVYIHEIVLLKLHDAGTSVTASNAGAFLSSRRLLTISTTTWQINIEIA